MYLCKRIVQFWKTLLALAFILTLCLIPSKELQKIDLFKFNYEDLVVHLIMFTAFSILLFRDMQRNLEYSQNSSTLTFYVFSLSMLLGIGTELMQYVLSSLNRTASITDLIFDLIGTVAGITIMRFIRR